MTLQIASAGSGSMLTPRDRANPAAASIAP
jgi:hypothetical protein